MSWNEQARINQGRRRAMLKTKGVCVDCGDYPAKEERVLCVTCLAKRSFRAKGTLLLRTHKPYKKREPKPMAIVPKKPTVEMIVAKAERIAQLRRWAA